jgi:hypothetical protein
MTFRDAFHVPGKILLFSSVWRDKKERLCNEIKRRRNKRGKDVSRMAANIAASKSRDIQTFSPEIERDR